MTQDDVLFGYRLQLFDLAARTNVSHACRTFGVHRSTYYRWKRAVDASGLEMREPEPEPRVESSRPGELVGIDCFFVGRLHGTRGPVWQITACDTYSSPAWADLVVCKGGAPTVEQTSALAKRVARELGEAGWRLERVLTDNGNEFGRRSFGGQMAGAGIAHTQIRAGRPQTNGHVERLHRTILEECWRPSFARYLQVRFSGLRRDLAAYLDYYNHERAHTGKNTRGRPPADLVYGARKMEPR